MVKTLKIAFLIQKFSVKIRWEVDRLQQRIFCESGPAGLVLQLMVYFQVKIAAQNRIKSPKMHKIFLSLSPTLLHDFLIIHSLSQNKQTNKKIR